MLELVSSVICVGVLLLIFYAYLLLQRTKTEIGLLMTHIDGIYAKIRKNDRLSALERAATRQEKKLNG